MWTKQKVDRMAKLYLIFIIAHIIAEITIIIGLGIFLYLLIKSVL